MVIPFKMKLKTIRASYLLRATGNTHDQDSDRNGDEARRRTEDELENGVGEPAREKCNECSNSDDEFDD